MSTTENFKPTDNTKSSATDRATAPSFDIDMTNAHNLLKADNTNNSSLAPFNLGGCTIDMGPSAMPKGDKGDGPLAPSKVADKDTPIIMWPSNDGGPVTPPSKEPRLAPPTDAPVAPPSREPRHAPPTDAPVAPPSREPRLAPPTDAPVAPRSKDTPLAEKEMTPGEKQAAMTKAEMAALARTGEKPSDVREAYSRGINTLLKGSEFKAAADVTRSYADYWEARGNHPRAEEYRNIARNVYDKAGIGNSDNSRISSPSEKSLSKPVETERSKSGTPRTTPEKTPGEKLAETAIDQMARFVKNRSNPSEVRAAYENGMDHLLNGNQRKAAGDLTKGFADYWEAKGEHSKAEEYRNIARLYDGSSPRDKSPVSASEKPMSKPAEVPPRAVATAETDRSPKSADKPAEAIKPAKSEKPSPLPAMLDKLDKSGDIPKLAPSEVTPELLLRTKNLTGDSPQTAVVEANLGLKSLVEASMGTEKGAKATNPDKLKAAATAEEHLAAANEGFMKSGDTKWLVENTKALISAQALQGDYGAASRTYIRVSSYLTGGVGYGSHTEVKPDFLSASKLANGMADYYGQRLNPDRQKFYENEAKNFIMLDAANPHRVKK